MKKENIIISAVVVFLMVFIQACGLCERISYEHNRKQIYLSANADDISQSGLDFADTLSKYKDAGVKYVTVSPKTIAQLEAAGKISTLTYSSLSINQDLLSQDLVALLSPYNLPEKTLLVISVSPDTTEYLRRNLLGIYPADSIIEAGYDEITTVFCFLKHESKDLIVGYDADQLWHIKNSGLKMCIEYPAYTFENAAYHVFFENFLTQNSPEFLILRKNESENKVHLSENFTKVLRNSGMFLTVFENENQISNEKSYIYNEMKETFSDNIVRGFNMDKVVPHDETKYMYRYYQWYNSALERNTTFLNVNILKNPDVTPQDNLSLTINAIQKLIEKTTKLGYEFPDEGMSIPYRYRLQPAAMCGAVMLIILLYIYLSLLGVLDRFKAVTPEICVMLLCAVLTVFSFAFYDYVTKYYALLIMIITSSLITLILFKLHKSDLTKGKKTAYMLLYPLGLAASAIISISALISDFHFFLGDKWFFGVKLSLTVPVLLTFYNYVNVYMGTNSLKDIKKIWENLKSEIKGLNKILLYFTGVIFVLALAYYLIRTGKSDLILPVEDKFRKLLTDILIIRPRFKEFLVGYPCFALFIYFGIFRNHKFLTAIFGIGQIILFTSVINTFCHTFTPIWIGILRTLNGFLSGIILCAVIIGIIELVYYIRKNVNTVRKEEK